ncbi:MAG: hypothetical protein A2231_08825 [Candidatus Firestonebacteria bacterium RIFOXYA2_FULL_40_8]|nr:MAG: hypothetical protein A2231_08825 [Candidatus Firestonebacteria bacterium RIFOXYA2_FULL_40_8]
MKGTIVFVGILIAVNILINNIIIIGFSGHGNIVSFYIYFLWTAIIISIVGAIIIKILKETKYNISKEEFKKIYTGSIKDKKTIATILLIAAYMFVYFLIPSPSYIMNLYPYYVGFFVCGVMLALRCKSESYVPILASAILVTGISFLAMFKSIYHSGIGWLSQPKEILETVSYFGVYLSLLPKSIAITWFAWRITAQIVAKKAV